MLPYVPQYAYNGLDILIKRFMISVQTIIEHEFPEPQLNTSTFDLMWRIRPDIQGGLDRLGEAYMEHVNAVYM